MYIGDSGYMQSNSGVYTPESQFRLDIKFLTSLGFTREEINMLQYIISCEGKVTPASLTYYNIPYEQARKLKYMYDIATGKKEIDSMNDFAKHLRRMFGQHNRISLLNLPVSKLSKIPRIALIDGIKDEAFAVYNSKRYKGIDMFYTSVIDVYQNRILIETGRKPVLKYKQSKKIDGVIEIKEDKLKNGNIIIAVNKNYSRLCNRYIIVAGLRRPEFHHGLVDILCIEGTKVYVYAITARDGELVKYNANTVRVYDYGWIPNQISGRLMRVAYQIYGKVSGVCANTIPPNADFRLIPPVKKQIQTIEDDIED